MPHFKDIVAILKKFRQETIVYKDKPVKLYNFWRMKGEPQDNWIPDFIEKRMINPDREKIAIFSVYGSRYAIQLYTGRRKVFYTGENVHSSQPNYTKQYGNHQLSHVNLSLGFEYIEAANYLRFPLWILYMIKPDATYNDIKQRLIAMRLDWCLENRSRNKFACMVASHDNNGIRTKIYNCLSGIDKIANGGALLNNTDELRERFHNQKKAFLEEYKFNICPENSNVNGYVTEKIFQSIASGCIPIYWGSDNIPEPEVINKQAVIFFSDDDEGKAMTRKVAEIHADDALYTEFRMQDPFLPFAAEYIYEKLSELEKEFRKMF